MAEERCPFCGFKTCQCVEIAQEKAKIDYAAIHRAAEDRRKLAEKEQEAEIDRLGGLRAYQDFTLDRFLNKDLLKALANYPNDNYFLWGNTGVGKTHAATAILRAVPEARVVTLAEILRELRACDKSIQEEAVIAKYSTGKFLFDDILTEKVTEFLRATLYEIINRRWLSKETGALFTANMDLDRIASLVGNKITSRIIDLVGHNNILQVVGKDYRVHPIDLL